MSDTPIGGDLFPVDDEPPRSGLRRAMVLKDLWGDYELLFGAGKLHLQIQEIPVHYQERIYGTTKMTRVFSNGVRMLKICLGAWRKLAG